MASPRIVLISGCSTGIGLHTALHLANDAEKRFKVYATMRNLEKKTSLEEEGKERVGETLVIMCMDVSCDESVKSVVEEIIAKEGKIDVLGKFRKNRTNGSSGTTNRGALEYSDRIA